MGVPPGGVEPRNPTTPVLTERSIEIIGHLFTIPILTTSNIQSPDRISQISPEELTVIISGLNEIVG